MATIFITTDNSSSIIHTVTAATSITQIFKQQLFCIDRATIASPLINTKMLAQVVSVNRATMASPQINRATMASPQINRATKASPQIDYKS